jgi:hypothetical protein
VESILHLAEDQAESTGYGIASRHQSNIRKYHTDLFLPNNMAFSSSVYFVPKTWRAGYLLPDCGSMVAFFIVRSA